MGQEILVTTDDLRVPTLRIYYPSNEETPTTVIPPETIKNLPSECTFVFIHPDHLESVFHNAKTHEQIAKHMRRLRLVLLNPVANRPGFAPPRGAESQNLHFTSRGAGADFRTSTNPEGREGR
ncbi:uncharacterized protein KD926_011176 [Aspergillus affinis]|uniref:uncharacterized protein n=1 Tax=Aspergillus affinis TaxID=1070780 RepID=UPI0022FE3A1D|nr:uncharacterized protein KD926_011176 [Aspergillus affinis]KAI9038237.1 hypothetical protein KD926_011176 [Aspergillus affinis]